ncbi:MAG TPA: diguanylate cyclase [Acidocella sp.]|nr:diguanylate cyclase [Acidocella sp.]
MNKKKQKNFIDSGPWALSATQHQAQLSQEFLRRLGAARRNNRENQPGRLAKDLKIVLLLFVCNSDGHQLNLTIKRRPDLLSRVRLHSFLPPLDEAAAITIVVAGVEILGLLLFRGVHGQPTIRLANGVLLGILLTSRRSHGPAYFAYGVITNVIAAYLVGFPLRFIVSDPLVNLLELGLALALLHRFVGESYDLSQPRILARFFVIAAVLVPAASTLLHAVAFAMHGDNTTFLLGLFLAHALAIITVTPVILALRSPTYARFAKQPRPLLSVSVWALFLVTTILVFAQCRYHFLFLVYPPLVFMVCLRGLVGGSLALFFTTFIAIGFTVHGFGPMVLDVPGSTSFRILMVQMFVSVAAFLVLPLSAILAERDRAALELERSREQLAELARTDALTGLANRRQLDETLERECRRANRSDAALSLLLLDVDHFKAFNDQYGHRAGDECLRAVSDVVKTFGRRPGDVAARYGGEELAVLLAPAPDEGAWAQAEALRQAVQDLGLPHAGNEASGVVTVSVGVATVHPQNLPVTPRMLIERADEMLYAAKRQGRNRVMASL